MRFSALLLAAAAALIPAVAKAPHRAPSAAVVEPRGNAGLWTVTSVATIKGEPPQPGSSSFCMTPADAMVSAPPADPTHRCSYSDVTVHGSTITAKMACQGGGAGVAGTVKMTYLSPTHYIGVSLVDAAGTSMTVKVDATWAKADCGAQL